MNSCKPLVGVYRTAFPLYSETFISEQIRALSVYAPLVITRTPHAGATDYDLVELFSRTRFVEALLFTAFGRMGSLSDNPRLSQLRLMHAHFAPDAVLAMPIAKHFGVPMITTCHGSDVTVDDLHIARSGKISGLRYLLERGELFSYGSKFLAVSKFLKDRMIAVGYPSDKVVLHYIGVDTARFRPNDHVETPLQGRRFILSIARHTDVKGLDILVDAFSVVARRDPQLLLVQIGSGELTTKLKAQASDLGVRNRILFLGAQPHREVLRYLQGCELLVLSSRRARNGAEESFGLVLAEAAACGAPIVATRVGGIPEAVLEGETGLLVPADNSEKLAEAISTLCNCPDVSSEMGRRGREFVCDCLNLGKQTHILESIYSEIS